MKRPSRSNVISIRPPPHVELACGFNGVKATKYAPIIDSMMVVLTA